MCGIAGVITKNGSTPDPALLDRLLAAIAHRGPDGTGRLVRANTALLHARLAIIDLQTGDQPLYAPGGTALICNGEIYNNPELRAAMADTPFTTKSDCEPAVFLYERQGETFAQHLRGMYAIALHDQARNRVLLARDPFGIKQLYYTETADLFAFASEPQALLAAGLAPRATDPTSRAELLQLKFTTGAATIFPGIHRLLPGETIVIEAGRIVARARIPAIPQGRPLPIRHSEALDRLDQVLTDSVAVHLRSDVPYGLFLSGGIDSATVLALMTRLGGRVRALSMGWQNAGAADESREAERLAAAQGADFLRLEMGENDFWTLAPQIAASIDDPTADAAVLPTWMLGRAARQSGLKVTLCGEGADEIFAGYSRYRKRRPPLSWISRKPRTKGLFGNALHDWRAGLDLAETRAAPNRTELQATQATDIEEWLPNDLLVKLDRCLMAHGVEGRTPFLDPIVARFGFLLPDHEKASLRCGKTLLRDWLAREFPQAGAYARKKGFKPPVGTWMQARGETLAKLVAAQSGIREILPATLVRHSFEHAETNPQRAWSLLFYALWHTHHIMALPSQGNIAETLSAAS